MAVDEAILDRYSTADPPQAPTLRLYGWNPPALSLGRGQPAGSAHDARYLALEGIDLVRRPTGGRAVLHEAERTYAVIGRLRAVPFGGGVLATYAQLALALAAGLRRVGLDALETGRRPAGPARHGPSADPACFATLSSHEIAVDGRKLVGSAQLRRRDGFLQHGSIPLRTDPGRLARSVGGAADGAAELRFTDLESALGRPISAADLDRALIEGFEESLSVRMEPGQLTPGEQERAVRLRAEKYVDPDWTLHGRWEGRRPSESCA